MILQQNGTGELVGFVFVFSGGDFYCSVVLNQNAVMQDGYGRFVRHISTGVEPGGVEDGTPFNGLSEIIPPQ